MMQLKHSVLSALTSLLLALALPAQAEPAMPTMVFGTSINGIRDVPKEDVELSFNAAIDNHSKLYGIITKFKVYENH